LGPAQCYSTDRVGFRPRQSLSIAHCSDSYRRSSPSRCRFPTAPGYRVTLHAPHRQREMRRRPYPLTAWLRRSKGPIFFLFTHLCSLLRACSACHRALCCRRVHRRSSVLRDAAPKPATALPADTSTGTIDLSSGRSPMAPLCPSCRERLHVHRCLRSSSSPATTPRGPHRRTAPLRLVNSRHRPVGHAVAVELAHLTTDVVSSPTPERTPTSDLKIRHHSTLACS
jgi:hypothetical protein